MQKNGFLKVTNLTTAVAAPDGSAPLQVKTVMVGKGDPGYSLTSGALPSPLSESEDRSHSHVTLVYIALISEAALALALAPRETLPPIGRRGGVLTPATALGDVLIDRLVASGRVTFESKVVAARSEEGKKTV